MSVHKVEIGTVRKCFIPSCNSTSMDSSKVLFSIPTKPWVRALWWDRANLSLPVRTSKRIHCCADHFDIPDDFKNWLYFRTVGSRLYVKEGVVPHKFLGGKPEPDHFLDAAKRKKIIDGLLADSRSASSVSTPSYGGTTVEVAKPQSRPQSRPEARLQPRLLPRPQWIEMGACANLNSAISDLVLTLGDSQHGGKKKRGVVSETCFCSDQGTQKSNDDQSRIRSRVGRTHQKRYLFEIPEDVVPKRRRPNILSRLTSKPKAETPKQNQNHATYKKTKPNPDKTPSKKVQILPTPTPQENVENIVVPETRREQPTAVCRETGLFTDQKGQYYTLDGDLMPLEEVEAFKKTACSNQSNSLTVCEETGLLKNSNGDYFSPNGKLLGREEVETERRAAEVRGRHLFRIGEIYSVDEQAESEVGRKTTLRIRDISSMIDKSAGSPLDDASEARRGCEGLRLRDISTMKSQGSAREETGELNGESSVGQQLRIVKANTMLSNGKEQEKINLGGQLPKIQFPFKKINFSRMRVGERSEAGSKQPLVKSLPPQGKSIPLPAKSPPVPETPSKVTALPASEAPSEGDTHIRNAEISQQMTGGEVVEIKNEPPDIDCENGRSPPCVDDEDTSSASETMNQENIQALIDSLDEADNYVDVPEFVQINKFTFKDLAALRERGLASAGVATPHGGAGGDATTLRDLLADPAGVQALERLMEEEVGKGRPTEVEEEGLRGSPKIRQRRRRMKIAPVAEETPPGGARSAYVERLVCVMRTPNREPEVRYPDREVCVLFTNYSDDGDYINDHDYLVTPYKRNLILTEEHGVKYCKCFICGSKHKVTDHVPHMSSHDSYCKICSVNLGTGYMLNLHMKSHASLCRHCSQLVAHPMIEKHARDHREARLASFTSSIGEKSKALPRVPKTPPGKKTPSRKRSRLEKSPSARKPSPSKNPSSEEVEPKVKIEKADGGAKKSVKRKRSTDEMMKREYVEKRILRSASKKTEIGEPPST